MLRLLEMDLYTLLVVVHAIGTILGAGGATVAEIQSYIARKDGKIRSDERALMHANYWMIRLGLAVIIVSGVILIWLLYVEGNSWVLTSSKLWAKELMAAIILINSFLLTWHIMPLRLGAAVSFVSWWGATVLGLLGRLPFTFVEYVLGYVATIALFALSAKVLRHRR